MGLNFTTEWFSLENSPISNLSRFAYQVLMGRKGTKGGKPKVPAGCSGPYRPYSSALKLEQLRRGYEKAHSSAGGVDENDADNNAEGKAQEGMELRSRPVLSSQNISKQANQSFKLDQMDEIAPSPKQATRRTITRSSTAGNGRRVSAIPCRVPTRLDSDSPRSEAQEKRRHTSTDDEHGGEDGAHMEVDIDMVAPLKGASAPRSSVGQDMVDASPTVTPAQRRVPAGASDQELSRKRRKYSSPHPSESGNQNKSTPLSSSRLSLGGGSAKESSSGRREPAFQPYQDAGNGDIENRYQDRIPPSNDIQTGNLMSIPLDPPSGMTTGDINNGLRLERLLTSIRSDILNEVRDAQKAQTAQLRRLDLKLGESIQSIRVELQDLSGIVQSRSTAGGSANSSGPAKTPLAEWEQKLEEMTPFKRDVFNSTVFARVLGYNLPLCVTQICATPPLVNERNEIVRNIVHKASDSLATLLFSLKPNDSRDKNAEGIGKLHSEFKFSVIQNTFYNVQKNTFLQFKTSGGRSDSESTNSVDRQGLLTQPLWLKPGFVSSTTILAARSFLENKQQAKRDKVKDAPSRSDVAMHGAVKVYRYLTSHLHDGREKVKAMFFQDLGYLLVDWAGLISDVDQSDLSLEWEEPSLDSNDATDVYFDLTTVPDTIVARGGTNRNDADTNNKDLINDLYKRSKEMVLIAEHEVFVIGGDSSRNKQRKHSGGQRRQIRRMIHMLEVAANFCTQFTQLPDVWAFLRSHTASLRCIYAIGIVFRELALNFLSKAHIRSRHIPSPSDVAAASTSLIHLLPGKGSRASLMASRCVRMAESEYELLNQPDNGIENNQRTVETGHDPDVGAEIQASASLGVAAL